MARKVKGQRRSVRKQKQRGGAGEGHGFSFTGTAFSTPGGVNIESRGPTVGNCAWDLRAPPTVAHVGAMRGGSRKQRGGGCGCNQRGGGGGTGGYSFTLDNSLGKVYDHLSVGACPATPRATDLGTMPLYQQGGEASYRDAAAINSYPSGWGVGPAGVVSTDSAHYVDPIRYGRHCMGGARRTKRKGRKNMTGRRRRQ